MKKLLLSVVLLVATTALIAQDGTPLEEKPFNRWSIDLGLGLTKPLNNMTVGYSTPTPGFGAAEIGARYMINELFGLKGAIYYNSYSEKHGAPEFSTDQYRLNLEGVMNLGRILRFESWTNRLNLLAHAGVGVGWMKYDLNPDVRDRVGSVITGLIGQVRLTDRVSLNLDGNLTANGRQQLAFDGLGRGSAHNFGFVFNGTVGLSIALGKYEKHADWYVRSAETFNILDRRITILEQKVDGTAQKGDVTGLKGDMDRLSRRIDGLGTHRQEAPVNYDDFVKKLISEGYVDIYFDFDKSSIDPASFAIMGFVKTYMMNNPGTSLEITGYADESGPEDYNKKLSQSRADAAARVLVEGGISESRLTVMGMGEDTNFDKSLEYGSRFARRVSFSVK